MIHVQSMETIDDYRTRSRGVLGGTCLGELRRPYVNWLY